MTKLSLTVGFLGLILSAPGYSDVNLHGATMHVSTLHALTTMVGLHPVTAMVGFLLVLGVIVYRFKKAKES